MKKVGLLFPHQLYKESEIINSCDKVYIIEDELYFGQYRFHKQKLLLHRASMKYYADFVSNKTEVEYIQSIDNENLETVLIENQTNLIHYFIADDYLLERRINRFVK